MLPSLESLDHETFMREALAEGQQALDRGDLPIGAVIIHDGRVVARGASTALTTGRVIAHAELNAILECAQFLTDHYRECVIYSTVEPCPMCLGAIVMANLRHVIWGTRDHRAGGSPIVETCEYVRSHLDTWLGGILEEECLALVRRFSEADAKWLTGVTR
jgi:tRNA(adenine34) deaminase